MSELTSISLMYYIDNSHEIAPNRRQSIFYVLTYKYGITDMDDLIKWTPPYDHHMYGLSKSEVLFLEDLRREELRIRNLIEMEKLKLKNRLIMKSPVKRKGEAIRAYNILVANGITNLRLLVAYSNDQLKRIKGIGPVRFEIIKRGKKELYES